MEGRFNPYSSWLGIAAEDQPPDYYRLLAIERFESDPRVIRDAAKAQLVRLKGFQNGEHAELLERLLKEVAIARNCLLNPRKKTDYDRRLRTQPKEGTGRSTRARQAAETSSQAKRKTSALAQKKGTDAASFVRRFRDPLAKPQSGLLPIVLGGVGGTLLALAIVYLIRVGGARTAEGPTAPPPRKSLAQKAAAAGTEPSTVQDRPQQEPARNSEKEETASEPNESGTGAVPADYEASSDETAVEDADNAGAGQLGEPDTTEYEATEAAETDSDPEPEAPPQVSTEPKKLSVPDDAQQEAAERKIRAIFPQEFGAASTPEQNIALATELLKLGLDESSEPLARFVLLRMACQHAVEAGGLGVALEAIQKIGQEFDVDPWAMKAEAAAKALHSVSTSKVASSRAEEAVRETLSLIDEAVADDNYDTANELTSLTATMARRWKNVSLNRELASRRTEIKRLRREFVAFEEALAVLAREPADQEANSTAGRWYCFEKNDWAKGLACLSKGGDGALAALAARDMSQPPAPEEQAELGDAWNDLSKGKRGTAKVAIRRRALHWYNLALPRLTGLAKSEVRRKRLEALVAVADPSSSELPGAIIEGNVALASNGTRVGGGDARSAPSMLDGKFDTYAVAPCPCEWTFVLNQVYRLQEVRVELFEDEHSYGYLIATSPDGKKYEPLTDRSRGGPSGPQEIRFPCRSVRAIKLTGLSSSRDNHFFVNEFEAYCVPSDLMKSE